MGVKSYTNISQSKKLAEILPAESADMHSEAIEIDGDMVFVVVSGLGDKTKPNYGSAIWSLAALLGVLPKIVNHETLFIETSAALWHIGYRNIYTAREDNPVDTCYELILKLNELKML